MSKQPLAQRDKSNLSGQSIRVTRADLDQAASEGIISQTQSFNLWNSLLAKQPARNATFDFANLAWYTGAIIVMMAMAWFMVEVWDLYSGIGILGTSAAYAMGFLFVGDKLWKKADLRVAGGLLITAAVVMVPFILFSLERVSGFDNPLINSQRYVIEFGTLFAGMAAFLFYRFSFLTAPISVGLWIITMDLANTYLSLTWSQERTLTMIFGLLMIVGSYVVDRLSRADVAYWGYLVGATAFWFALTIADRTGELARFGYFAVNVGLMILSVLLGRKILVVYGAIGVIYYLGYLTFSLFANSTLFPLVLTVFGLAIIYGGVYYQRNRQKIESAILSLVPEMLKPWLPGAD